MDKGSTVDDLALLALGTRLKRLGERLHAETSAFLRACDIPVPAGSLPVLVSIQRHPGASVGDIVTDLGTAQPGVTRTLTRLADAGLISHETDPSDARRRTVTLTSAGAALLARAESVAWGPISAAVADALADEPRPLLGHIEHLEAALDDASLTARAQAASVL